MRIITADDEWLVRSTLKSMLEELGEEYQIVGEARNGEELLELVLKLKPDLVFVDIKMPNMTGLDVIGYLDNRSLDCEWVILTGFSEFEYARQAIQLGVHHYLLKPLSIEDLQQVVQSVKHKCSEKALQENKIFESWLTTFVYSQIKEAPPAEIQEAAEEFDFCVSVYYIDSHLNEADKFALLKAFKNKFNQVIPSLVSRNNHFCVIYLPDGNVMSVSVWRHEVQSAVETRLKFHHFAEQSVLEMKDETFGITMYSVEGRQLDQQLFSVIRHIEENAKFRILEGIHKPLSLDKCVDRRWSKNAEKLCTILMHLVDAYHDQDYDVWTKGLLELESEMKFVEHLIQQHHESILSYLRVSIRFDQPFDAVSSWITQLRNYGQHLLKQSSAERIDPIDYMKKRVEESFKSNLTIAQLADELNVTPNYLSTKFHKKTGTPFVKYLTSVRMMKAQQILSDPKVQVQEAAERVGYFSTRHFTKLFVAYTGQYPSEFKKKFLK